MQKREIRVIMQKSGKSEAELAEIAGVSHSTFRGWYYQQHAMPRLAARALRLLVSHDGLAELLIAADKPLSVPRSFRLVYKGVGRPAGSTNKIESEI